MRVDPIFLASARRNDFSDDVTRLLWLIHQDVISPEDMAGKNEQFTALMPLVAIQQIWEKAFYALSKPDPEFLKQLLKALVEESNYALAEAKKSA